MVNVYISSEEAERRSPYASNAPAETAAEADYRNITGRRNREAAGLGSDYGRSEQYQEQQRQDQAAQEQNQQQQDYERQALQEAQRRPGFTALGSLGDRSTETFTRTLEQQNSILGLMGLPLVNVEAATGAFLESQRQQALTTPGTRDDQFFANELSKWAENKVEVSSQFHYVTRDATNVKENPFEVQGDLAVEFLKGSPDKRSEFFSPISGQMSRYLPGGQGIQEVMWTTARTGKAQPGSFADAVQVINSSSGGLSTGTIGKPNRTTINTPTDSFKSGIAPSPFISGRPAGTLEKLNYDIGGALGIRASGLEQRSQGLPAPFISRVQAAPPGGIVSDAFGFYERMNQIAAPFTTDISGIGRALKKTPDVVNMGIVGDVLNFAKGVYVGASQHPFDIAATFAGGSALGIGEGLAKTGVARAATSGIPGVSTAGRALSSPLAGDIARVGKAGIGAFFVYEAGKNIANQPTATGKGEAAGRTAIQFAGFGVGNANVGMAEPDNPYAGRGFFSGKPEIGPIERIQFKLETTARSLTTSQPGGYREVAAMTLPGRVVEPMRKAEPDFTILSKSGEYASEIKTTLMEQPHSVMGSSSVNQQYPANIAESAGLRVGKDVDVLIQSPRAAVFSLSEKTGLVVIKQPNGNIGIEGGVLDPHVIPKGYPGFKPSIEADTTTLESSMFTRAFGDPYRNVATPRGTSEVIKPGEGYTGDLTYEAAQVQFGRKGAAVSAFIENPIKKGYRAEKDIYDFITEYRAQRQVAIATGTAPEKFTTSDRAMASFMDRQFTFGTVKGQRAGDSNPIAIRTVRDIYSEMYSEAGSTRAAMRAGGNIPGKIELTFTSTPSGPGYVSSAIRSAPGSSLFSSGMRPSFIPSAGSPSSSGRSSPGSSPSPRSNIPSISPRSPFISSPPSRPPVRSSTSIYTPPGSPPSGPARTPISPPGSPSRVPFKPSIVPPSTPTTSPPRSPPRSPPSSPPYDPTITPTPPRSPPGLWLPGAGENTNQMFAPRGSYKWSRLNPTTTLPYLAAGMRLPSLPGIGKRKKKRSPFG